MSNWFSVLCVTVLILTPSPVSKAFCSRCISLGVMLYIYLPTERVCSFGDGVGAGIGVGAGTGDGTGTGVGDGAGAGKSCFLGCGCKNMCN